MRTKSPKKMQEIIDFVDSFYEENGCTPNFQAIADHVGTTKSMIHSYLFDARERGLLDYDHKMIRTEKILDTLGGFNRVPIVGSIPCGRMEMEEEYIEGYVNLPISVFGRGALFILRCYGDSMINAGIEDGDMVVARKKTTVHDGDIVVAYVEDYGTTLKRFYDDEENHRIILHPENEQYEDIYTESVMIQGVVTSIIKRTEAFLRC